MSYINTKESNVAQILKEGIKNGTTVVVTWEDIKKDWEEQTAKIDRISAQNVIMAKALHGLSKNHTCGIYDHLKCAGCEAIRALEEAFPKQTVELKHDD